MAPLAVDPAALDGAGSAVVAVGEGLAAAVGALTAGFGANTGQDAAGEVFGLNYQTAAESTLKAAAAGINACRRLGFKVQITASNYSKAEAASTLGGGVSVLPTPTEPAEFAPPGAPWTLGPGVPEPMLWAVVEAFVGDLWPNGNAAQMHAAAGCWRTFGAALHGAKDTLAGPNSVVGAQQMPESGLIQQAFCKLGDDMAAIGAECDKLAKSLDDFANQVQQTQDAIRDLLHRLGSVSGLFHEVVEIFKGHGLDEVKKIADDIKAVLRNLMREAQAREEELSRGMQMLDGLVRGLQIYVRSEITHFVGEDVGNPLATAFDIYTNVGEGLVKDVVGLQQGVQALNPLRFGYDPKGAAATWKGLGEMLLLGNPTTAPIVNALDPQAAPNLAKGLLHTEDWRADRPGLGAGENLGDLLMLGIPGVGEAGATVRGTEAAGAASRAAEEADAAAAAGRGGRALGEAGELGRATGALGDVSKTSDALTKDLQNVGGNLPKPDPPAGGRPAGLPPGHGEPPVGPAPRPAEPAPAPRAEPPSATRPQEPVPLTPREAEPPVGPHEPATVGEPSGLGGVHEPAPVPAGQHSAPAPAAPAEQLSAPGAHVGSPPIAPESGPTQPTLASAHTPQSAPISAPHEPIPDSHPGGGRPPEPPPSHGPSGLDAHGGGEPSGSGGPGGGGDGLGGHGSPGEGHRIGDQHGGSGEGGHEGDGVGDHGIGGADDHQPPKASDVFPGAKPYGDLTKEQYEAQFLDDDGRLIYPDADDPAKPYAIPGTVRNLTEAELANLDGKIVDRVGHPGGAWLAPEGTPYEGRALPHDSLDKELHKYIIHAEKGLPPGWKIEESLAAPWFGHPGGELQYRIIAPRGAKARTQDLIDRGFLEDICGQYYGGG
jgi:hypothetical protein